MIRILTIMLLMALPFFITAQTCSPDPIYADSSAGVYPAPITPTNPDGGINEPACIGAYYEFPLTVIVPDSVTIDFNGFPITLDIITAQIPTEGAIQGLPEGLDYLCMPSDCVFPSDSSGCLLLYGTVDENAMPGAYPLSIQLDITLDGLGTQTFDFPGPQFPGSYDLTVSAPNDPSCANSLNNTMDDNPIVYPNPVTNGFVQLHKLTRTVKYAIYNATGKLVQSGNTSQTNINVSQLPKGLYIIRFYEGNRMSSKKLIISN